LTGIENVTGVILAGGGSSRMGTDKALLSLGDRTFIGSIAGTLGFLFNDVMIISDHGDRYGFLELPVQEDIRKDAGPLGGIHAALSSIKTHYAFVIACDLPLVSRGACLRVLSAQPRDDVVVARNGDRIQPLFGLYSKGVLPEAEERLGRGENSVMDFLEQVRVTVVDFQSPSQIRNINTPEEYATIQKK
jgi:molybdopterin-guanine dinucleotide biosynthesis protein A